MDSENTIFTHIYYIIPHLLSFYYMHYTKQWYTEIIFFSDCGAGSVKFGTHRYLYLLSIILEFFKINR